MQRLFERLRTTPGGPGLFSSRTRRAGAVWVAACVPAAILVGLVVDGTEAYLAGWVLLSSLCVVPALGLGAVLRLRVAGQCDEAFWGWWLAGVVCMCLVGSSIVASIVLGVEALLTASTVAGVATTASFTVALVRLMRRYSGSRMLTVDVLSVTMVVTAVVAVVAPLVAEPILGATEAWFTIPSALAAVGLLYAFCWSMLLLRRVSGAPRLVEAVGVVAAGVAVLGAVAQTAQGISGFTLPAAPLFGLQVLCMGLLMMTPLCRMTSPPAGLERLPPHAQVRRGFGDALIVVGLFVVLMVEVQTVAAEWPWSQSFFAVVALVQLVLLSLRFHLVSRETRRLYGRVRESALQRQRLLADLVAWTGHERHRLATQLHEQASSSYVAFATHTQATYTQAGRNGGSAVRPDSGAMRSLRAELAEQADGLRRLMLATEPADRVQGTGSRLMVLLVAHLDALYGDEPLPTLVVDVDDQLELDWVSETIVLRLAQEAIRGIWAGSGATHLSVGVAAEGAGLDLRVAHDGSEGWRADDPTGALALLARIAQGCGGTLEWNAPALGAAELIVRIGTEHLDAHHEDGTGVEAVDVAPVAARLHLVR